MVPFLAILGIFRFARAQQFFWDFLRFLSFDIEAHDLNCTFFVKVKKGNNGPFFRSFSFWKVLQLSLTPSSEYHISGIDNVRAVRPPRDSCDEQEIPYKFSHHWKHHLCFAPTSLATPNQLHFDLRSVDLLKRSGFDLSIGTVQF